MIPYRSNLALWLLWLVYAAIALGTLPHYGITWDEIFHYISGDMMLDYLRTGELKVEDNSNLRFYGPLIDTLGSLSQSHLHTKREWLDYDVARHLPSAILGVLIVPLVFAMTAPSHGRRAAFFAAVAMALSPHFFSYLHNDPKDTGIAFFVTACLWTASRRARGGSWLWLLGAAFMFGFGFATKLTIALVLPMLIAWFLLQTPRHWRRPITEPGLARFTELAVVLPFLGLVVGVICYPWLWENPLHRVVEVLRFFAELQWLGPVLFKGEILHTNELGYDFALTMFTIQNPLFILGLAVLGSASTLWTWRRRRRTAGQLALIGLTLFMIVAMRSPQHAHDGLREFLPILPLLSILAGVGAESIWRRARRFDLRRKNQGGRAGAGRLAASVVLAVGFVGVAWFMIALHPDQTAYFNRLVGGAKGAEGRYEIEFYCNPYKRGMAWLDERAPQTSAVIVPLNYYAARYYDTPNIRSIGDGRARYVMTIPRLHLDHIVLPPGLEVIHEIKAGGATVLTIYEFSGGRIGSYSR